MATRDEAIEALAEAVARLSDAEFSNRNVTDLLQRLYIAERRMDEAIAKADTFEELFDNIGEGLVNLILEAATRFIRGEGPAGLAEAALKGIDKLTDFLNGAE